ncbi:hypothetical protein CDL12_04116 [Handroanthus impetiginosus]|uniref:Uncharacterized protein n=1 Tax=Handroanthus impetiginosus TaxID=429701 RepID=A0A2G9I060_9LAMI|nr:hypothetical protein CDL12_04116 [Handroanthus impetiginosus]
MFTGLLWNLSLLSYFMKKREAEAVVVQMMGLLSINGFPHFIATLIVIACGRILIFMNYFHLLVPEIWHFGEELITMAWLSALPKVIWYTFVLYIPNTVLPSLISFVTAMIVVVMVSIMFLICLNAEISTMTN